MTAPPGTPGGAGAAVLVTGASGFVGRRVCAALAASGRPVVAAVRDARARAAVPGAAAFVEHGDLAAPFDWAAALDGVGAVVHCAARVHVMRESARDPLAAFRAVNVEATRRLAEAATRSGVRRFVYLSSVKAMGEGGPAPYVETDPPRPGDPYGQSKLEAEQALHGIARASSLAVAVLRPPLVYGPGVGGNFVRLLRLAELARRVPLPLGGIANRRSLLYVENLASAVVACVAADPAPTGVFLVSDGDDLSTSELIARLARAGGGRPRLVRAPAGLIERGARLAGLGAEASRLLGTLQVDASRIRRVLGWRPPVSVDEALRQTVAWHRSGRAPSGQGARRRARA